MRILLTGGTGLIGRALCKLWAAEGHELSVWSRSPQRVPQLCSGARGVAALRELGASALPHAVVNLAGAPIAEKPWNGKQRKVLWNSRVDVTRELVDWIGQQVQRPDVLISGSAVGWYGDCGDRALDESSLPGPSDFGSELCAAWEHEAERVQQLGVRVVLLRTAPVLSNEGGILPKMTAPFRLGLGARFGSGQQWMPWIHLEDQVRLIDHLLRHEACKGIFNACSPGQVTNAEFTQTLAAALRRPAIFTIPGWALRLGLGEMSVLLLGGQHLAPKKALAEGFRFRFATLEKGLGSLM